MPDRAALMEMDAGDLLDFKAAIQASIAEVVAPYLGIPEMIDSVIERRFSDAARTALEKAGKTHGKVTVDLPDGLKLGASVTQRVEWEQDKLKAIAKDMPSMDEIEHYFNISFKVPEKIYKAIPPGALKKKFEDARTTTLGDLKVTLERKDAAPAASAAGG